MTASCQPALDIDMILDNAAIDAYWAEVEQEQHKPKKQFAQHAYGQKPYASMQFLTNEITDEVAEESVDVSSSITQSWTDQAIKCYLSQSDCANCSIPRGNYSFTCQMNKVVPALLNQLGKPDLSRKEHIIYQLDQY